MTQLMVLHWGTVTQIINVAGGDVASGDLAELPGDGVVKVEAGRGSIKSLVGRGGSKGIAGSGGKG